MLKGKPKSGRRQYERHGFAWDKCNECQFSNDDWKTLRAHKISAHGAIYPDDQGIRWNVSNNMEAAGRGSMFSSSRKGVAS